MSLDALIDRARNKENFRTLRDYTEFSLQFLDFVRSPGAIQTSIVSRNESHYRFIRFNNAASSVSRPLNSNLFYDYPTANAQFPAFAALLHDVRANDSPQNRDLVNRSIYTLQQSIGATLDALPGSSNAARKINGDIFERLITLVLEQVGVSCTSGVVKVPVSIPPADPFTMNYQHDLIIKSGEAVKIIGSVKTSSKDRLGKVFVDKFLLHHMTGKNVPHVAIFLNDVQRKGKASPGYGINSTFLAGHFKGHTLKLNPLDGVYYFDIRPNMQSDALLAQHIRTFDRFLFTDLWEFLQREAIVAQVEPTSDEAAD